MQKGKYFRNGLAISDDEALDADGMIRSGVAMRVPMKFADALQRSVAKNNKRATLVDAHGAVFSAAKGGRPGYRILVGDAGVEAERRYAEEARRQWIADMNSEWKTDARNKANKPGADEDEDEEDGDDDDENETSDAQRQRVHDAYAAHDAYLKNAWRGK
jgi:hypothetical protein